MLNKLEIHHFHKCVQMMSLVKKNTHGENGKTSGNVALGSRHIQLFATSITCTVSTWIKKDELKKLDATCGSAPLLLKLFSIPLLEQCFIE